jgi:hypothetical protein
MPESGEAFPAGAEPGATQGLDSGRGLQSLWGVAPIAPLHLGLCHFSIKGDLISSSYRLAS